VRERDIEAQLVKRVKQLGGEIRKVKWVGRDGAPDRVVMLPLATMDYVSLNGELHYGRPSTIWIEVKRPGGAATFPANAHERKQAREHRRMQAMGQRVEVVDSFERIEEILA
jgi:hypothetical protein